MKRWGMLGILAAVSCVLALWAPPVLAGEPRFSLRNQLGERPFACDVGDLTHRCAPDALLVPEWLGMDRQSAQVVDIICRFQRR